MKKLSLILVIGVFLTLMATSEVVQYPEGMISYWKFDNVDVVNAGIAEDSVGENNGTIHGATWTPDGKVGGAMSFNNDWIVIPDHESLNPEFMSLEAWIYVDHLESSYNTAVAKNSPYYYHLYMLAFGTETHYCPEFWVHPWPGTCQRVYPSERIREGEWIHWAGTYDEEFARLYLNGELVAERVSPGTPIPRVVGPLFIGRNDGAGNHNFHGVIDEVALYNRALTAEEVLLHYENGLVGLGYELPTPSVLEVEIDIKPGSDPNTINLGSKGVIPVAILSSMTFDATEVNPTTVSLGGAGVAVRGKGKSLAHAEDVNGDGLPDLVVQVETESLGFDTEAGDLILTGFTYEGQEIKGTDTIVIVPSE